MAYLHNFLVSALTKEQNINSYVDVCGTHAAFLSLSEVGLGSILHSFHLPFSGHILSLNQIFLLSRASYLVGKNGSVFVPGTISFIAAALKSLSPAGKKLTPMLAISMQGILFNSGIVLLGHNSTGRTFGACVSSLWGFIQPLLIYYFIFGNALFHTLIKIEESFRNWVPMDVPSVWYLCIIAVSIKALLAVGIANFAPKISQSTMTSYTQKLRKARLAKPVKTLPGKQNTKKVAILAARDLCVWPFMACVFLSAVSFLWVEGPSSAWLVWAVLRPLAIGFVLFFAMRILPMEKLATWLEKNNFNGLGKAFQIALTKIKEC